MKAAVLHAQNQPLTIEEVALQIPGNREVRLGTAIAGLCHSDLHFIEGLYPYSLRCMLGHESNRFRVDMPRLLSFNRQGKFELDRLISGRVRLAEINQGSQP